MIQLRGWESVLFISPSLTLEYIFPRENIKQKEREREEGGGRESGRGWVTELAFQSILLNLPTSK